MKQIAEIRERAEVEAANDFIQCVKGGRGDFPAPKKLYSVLADIPRLCDALEFVMAIARDECESPYFDEIAKILEGK